MLPKKLRLDFISSRLVFTKGKHVSDAHLLLYYTRDTTTPRTWLVQIQKKVVKKAHDRNRLRRIIEAAIVNLTPQFNNGGLTTIKVTRSLTGLKTQDIEILLKALLTKAGIL